MYRQFQFEGEVHQVLDCVPLTVRRKLDLAQLKISLAAWQQLPRAERLALCHLPVDGPGDLEVYREVLQGFAARSGVPLTPLQDPDADPKLWRGASPPPVLAARLDALGVKLDALGWAALDEEARYALCKLAGPRKGPEKLAAAVEELGLRNR